MKDEEQNKRARKFDRERLLADSDPLVVAETIGMDIEYRGSKVSVLCPSHDDRNHGSCYITEKGCHCYVCGEDFNVFEMVMHFCEVSFRRAAGIVADTCGGRDVYMIDSDEVFDASVLNKKDLDLLDIVSRPLYVVDEIITSGYVQEVEKGYRHEYCPGKDEDSGGYVAILRSVYKNPLQALRECDEAAYNELVCEKAVDALIEFRRIFELVYEWSTEQAQEYRSGIRRIEEILIEHGASLTEVYRILGLGNPFRGLFGSARYLDDAI